MIFFLLLSLNKRDQCMNVELGAQNKTEKRGECLHEEKWAFFDVSNDLLALISEWVVGEILLRSPGATQTYLCPTAAALSHIHTVFSSIFSCFKGKQPISDAHSWFGFINSPHNKHHTAKTQTLTKYFWSSFFLNNLFLLK